jgi:hypothetical protein
MEKKMVTAQAAMTTSMKKGQLRTVTRERARGC